MSGVPRKKRKVDSCPNRLFLSYLKTWRDEASSSESKAYHVYNKAHRSMSKYPLPLQNGKEASIIENIGDKICSMLDKKLNKDAEAEGMAAREFLEKSRKVHSSWWEKLEKDNAKPAKKTSNATKSGTGGVTKRKRDYVPVKNSGPYALLIALYEDSTSPASFGFMKKADLQRAAQPYCTKSFTVPEPGSQYTAWSSMASLLNKELVKKSGNPAKFEIMPSGVELAQKLLNADNQCENKNNNCQKEPSTKSTTTLGYYFSSEKMSGVSATKTYSPSKTDNVVDLTLSDNSDTETEMAAVNSIQGQTNTAISSSVSPSSQSSITSSISSTISRFSFQPGCFKISLCVDTREVRGESRKKEMRRELEKLGVKYVERVLQVGDFVWVAQEKALAVGPVKELVLDYVVERKCMSDLAQSIRDGRFHEQKIRLKQCGLKNIIYLVEDLKQFQHQSLPENTLRQALHNTRITDGIFVKYSDNIKNTAEYLSTMTKHLQKLYENKHLNAVDCPDKERQSGPQLNLLTIDDFNDGSMKNKGLTVKEMFYKFLMQIHGMSFDKAQAIANVYSTPQTLFNAYNSCSNTKEREQLLSKIKCGILQRNLGINLSQVVFHVIYDNS